MSQIDRIKEELGWLKVAFGISVALDASLIAWLAQNYETARPVIVFVAAVAALGIGLAVILINRRAFRRMDELEDL